VPKPIACSEGRQLGSKPYTEGDLVDKIAAALN
jgi:hypothetical protein